MFQKILVPTDGSELSDKAIKGAIDYAQRTGASLVGVSVVNPMPMVPLSDGVPVIMWEDVRTAMEQSAKDFLQKFKEAAQAAKLSCETVLATDAQIWQALLDTAKSQKCDAIFMASHGRKGVSALLLGSTTQKVLTHSDLPVLVYR